MNQFCLGKVECEGKRIVYRYEVIGEWEKYFHLEEEFFIEYSESIDGVPESVAVIPLLVNILPMAWVHDAEIILKEVDKDFYEHISEIKQGYIDMFPCIDFKGKLTAEQIVDNSYISTEHTATFFSGGVDAFSTLITHIDEKPTLITLNGSDIQLGNTEGWEKVYHHAVASAQEFGCKNLFITSSFRKFLNEQELTDSINARSGENWWHGFQHGIGLIGHAAPYAYLHKLKIVYIASSFTIREKGIVTCASDPTIDNHVHMASCQTVHDGYEFTRQAKIHRICEYKKATGKRIPLRVCWESSGGGNCCTCEKCYRTIMAVAAENQDPHEYGFIFDDSLYQQIEREIKRYIIFDTIFLRRYWMEVQETLRANIMDSDRRASLEWALHVNFENMDVGISVYKKRFFRFIRRFKRKLFG